MLSLFPELLFLSPLAALLIRIAVGGVFAYSAYRRIQSERATLKGFGIIDGVLAVMFVAGAYTQLAALIGAICAIVWIVRQDMRPVPRSTAALIFVMCVSLLLTGAGAFAFDLPL